ncbi:MAG: ABC-F family ATP-binding cassette domain-containing protein [Candidatus Saccharibacteria bacterium]|nr:ABC-F family ATP-binding cassette domain-containing protein [Candidatus Saccharibacteria bacterium]
MIANINIEEKSFGNNLLYENLSLKIQAGEKLGFIGRNGTGKTTLFHMLTGEDKDFAGDIEFQRNLIVASSRQEHHGFEDSPVLPFILEDLPQYKRLKNIIDTYPEHMGSNPKKMEVFSEALEQFSSLGYYQVEEEIRRSLQAYGLQESHIEGTIGQLSGGQKRFVELAKLQHSKADLILIDEPTNHMDYAAKELFLEWLKHEKAAVMVITHDRDVLKAVDRIIEIRDGKSYSFRGNYDDYLRTNTSQITSEVNEYEVTQRRISNLKDEVLRFQRLKEKARNPGTIQRFKSQEQRARKELERLSKQAKPSFWIDKESVQGLNNKLADAYDEHKARNIRIRARTSETKSRRLLVEAHKVVLSYGDEPLFDEVSFQLREGERLRLHGRNGAGKTTLVNAILAENRGASTKSNVLSGYISTEKGLKIGDYKQEIDGTYLNRKLKDAVEHVLLKKNVNASDQKIRQLLSDYLFQPESDGEMPVSRLSGGQKARFQLMSMLADDPMVLILDEPTNHLDLPSIEELEQALKQYHGAIIYISHDSYFTQNIGGEQVNIDKIV